jgi:predicted nucleic acid-binding protein
MVCLDTTVLVELLRSDAARKRRALAKIELLITQGASIVTTRFNLAELYLGIELSSDPRAERQKVDRVLAKIDAILEFGDSAAHQFGSISAHLRRIGRPGGDLDILIAATTMAAGHSLVTRNPSDFADIPHLVVEAY